MKTAAEQEAEQQKKVDQEAAARADRQERMKSPKLPEVLSTYRKDK